MFGAGFCNFSFWWLVPIAMMIVCLFMMRARKGSMICGFGSHNGVRHKSDPSDSAMDILDRRYANGEINEEEYEKKKIILTWDNGP